MYQQKFSRATAESTRRREAIIIFIFTIRLLFFRIPAINQQLREYMNRELDKYRAGVEKLSAILEDRPRAL